MNAQQAKTALAQIGKMNVLAISGGRARLEINHEGQVVLALPVASGYRVEVEYVEGRDTYTVRRVYVRGAKRFVKGEIEDVYADEIGEVAYQAHAFRSYEFGSAA